jgi:cytochrome b561
MPSPQMKYDGFARLMHWLVVLLLIVQYAVAWTMPDIRRDTQPVGLVAWHLSLGTAILAVMVVRLAWRAFHAAPPSQGPALLVRMAHLGHLGLYVLLFLVPILGWVNASSRDYAVALFGFIPLPPLSPAESNSGHAAGDIHIVMAWVLIVLVAGHVLAALYHHFVLRDGTLRKMMPGDGRQ